MKNRIFTIIALLIIAATGVKAAVSYRSASWDGMKVVYTDKSASTTTTVSSSTTSMTNGKWYYVSSNVTVSSAITVTGTVNIILKDGVKLTANAGIRVATGNTLNIYAQTAGTGAITAKGNANGLAGIGGGALNESGGTINIHGGAITATGSTFAAGIGAGGSSNYTITDGGTVTIYGGTITATGGKWAAGIGGGADGNGANVTIYGGTVTATGDNNSATQNNAYGIGMGAQDKTGRTNGSLTLSDRMVLYGGASSASSVINKSGSNYTRYRFMKAVPVSFASLLSGNVDAAKWSLSATKVNVGAALTATYSGKRKVKTVEAWQKPDILLTSITLNKTSASIVAGPITLSVASYAPSDASNKVVTWSSDNTAVAVVNASTGVVYPIKAGTAHIRATARDGSGVYAQCTVTVNNTDLSMVDCAGNARTSQWTANSYMVHTAGKYALPLVYGNAIKNGAANTAAYTGVSSFNCTTTFPNHAGNAINAPWITKSTSGSGVDRGMGISVASAQLLWQDVKGLITAVGISGDYLTLTVGKNATDQEGNALIAVKDGSGTIVWSWHIWVTKQTFAAANLTTVNTGLHTYKVAPVYLGFIGNEKQGGTWRCTYYQWGRKDPFVPTTGHWANDQIVYNINNSTVTSVNYQLNTNITIADHIKNPRTHYYTGDTGTSGTCNSIFLNLWDAQQTLDNDYNHDGWYIATATKKTVYDPCPPGFCVPTSYLFAYLYDLLVRVDPSEDQRIRVYKGSTPYLYFPALGCRGYGSGEIAHYNSHCQLWTASAIRHFAVQFYFQTSNRADFVTERRASACPVMAVAEE